jgi:hypothetical protein
VGIIDASTAELINEFLVSEFNTLRRDGTPLT